MKEWILSCLIGTGLLIGGGVGVAIFWWVLDHTFPYGVISLVISFVIWITTMTVYDIRKGVRRRKEDEAARRDTTTSGGYG
jgi:hypothetical protein